MRHPSHWIAASILAGVVAFACSSSSSSTPPLVTSTLASQSIGPEGGTLTGGSLTITVPPGAVSAPTTFTINKVVSGGTNLPNQTSLAGDLYELLPDDVTFQAPVSVSVTIDQSKVPINGLGAEVLLRSTAGSSTWTPYAADQNGIEKLTGQTTHFSFWAPASAAETACFVGVCGPFAIGNSQNPAVPPGLDCTVPLNAAQGVHCFGMAADKGPPYQCTCIGSDVVLGQWPLLPPDTAVTAMAAQCGGTCPPGSLQTCDMGLSCTGGAGAWSCTTTFGPTMACKYDATNGATCTCEGDPSVYPLQGQENVPTNADLFPYWIEDCAGNCTVPQIPCETENGVTVCPDAAAPPPINNDWVCPGDLGYPNEAGTGCIVHSAGMCRDNNYYGYECESSDPGLTTCYCETNGVRNGTVVQSTCPNAWTACGFPAMQGDNR